MSTRAYVSYTNTCLESKVGFQQSVVCHGQDKVVVEVVISLRFRHLAHVRVDLEVTQVTLLVLRYAVAARSDAVWYRALKTMHRVCVISGFIQQI